MYVGARVKAEPFKHVMYGYYGWRADYTCFKQIEETLFAN